MREHERRSRVALRLFARTAFPVIADGFRAPSRYLVLRGASYQPGLFSQFATVLGLLEHFDDWRDRYAGLLVDFANEGLYYDPSIGNNWWEYFFEPIAIGSIANAAKVDISDDENFYFARRVETSMPRRRGFDLIDRYIRLKPHIREKVEFHVGRHFNDVYVIGIHYRGTDKHQDAPRVPYEEVRAAALEAINSCGNSRYGLFLATDEQAFVEYMQSQFPGRLSFLDMRRSADGKPIDVTQGDNYRKGEDAVLDCLLLSRCDCLVRTASNLSLCSTLFNPDMRVALLNHER